MTCARSAAPYTGWAGFNYDHGLPREQAKEVIAALRANDIRAVMLLPTFHRD